MMGYSKSLQFNVEGYYFKMVLQLEFFADYFLEAASIRCSFYTHVTHLLLINLISYKSVSFYFTALC